MKEEEFEKLLKAIKKLQNFESKHKLNDPNAVFPELSDKRFDKWIKLTKAVFS